MGQESQLGWYCSNQVVVGQFQVPEFRKEAQVGRDGAIQVRRGQVQEGKARELGESGGKRARQNLL